MRKEPKSEYGFSAGSIKFGDITPVDTDSSARLDTDNYKKKSQR